MTALEQWNKTRKNLTGQCWGISILYFLFEEEASF